VHYKHTKKDWIKYAATLPNRPERRILTDYFNCNFSKAQMQAP